MGLQRFKPHWLASRSVTMNKNLFCLALFLLPWLASANMDDVCLVHVDDYSVRTIEKSIAEQNCVRNNILQVVYTMPNADDRRIFHQSSRWCRFDRNRDIRGGILSCVLYSKNSRKFLDIKWLGCPMKTNELLYEALNKRHGELKSVTDARCLIDVLKREFNLSSTQVVEFLVYKNKPHNESKPLSDIDKS